MYPIQIHQTNLGIRGRCSDQRVREILCKGKEGTKGKEPRDWRCHEIEGKADRNL